MHSEEYQPQIVAHIERLLQIKELRSARIVLILENNCGGILLGGIMNRLMAHFPGRLIHMRSDPRKIGLVTTNKVKAEMATHLTERFMKHELSLYENFVTEFVDRANPKESIPILLEQVQTQLLQYSAFKKEGDDPFKPTKVKYSGKLSKGVRDDLAVTLQLCLYWRNHFWNDYQTFGASYHL